MAAAISSLTDWFVFTESPPTGHEEVARDAPLNKDDSKRRIVRESASGCQLSIVIYSTNLLDKSRLVCFLQCLFPVYLKWLGETNRARQSQPADFTRRKCSCRSRILKRYCVTLWAEMTGKNTPVQLKQSSAAAYGHPRECCPTSLKLSHSIVLSTLVSVTHTHALCPFCFIIHAHTFAIFRSHCATLRRHCVPSN